MNYKVWKDGRPLELQTCKIFPKPYNAESRMEYVMFAAGERTELVVESEIEVTSVVIRPLNAKIPFEIRDGRIVITIDRPVKVSVEINGSSENNLMLFAHKETSGAIEESENLILIKKDAETSGTVTVDQDNTCVYLEEGAVLAGNILAENCENLTICGFGKICMERYSYEMRKDFARSVDIIGCRNVTIRDIIIDDSNDWSMRINGCDNVVVDNVKIFGCRGNSDGIDVCGSRNVTVTDIFTRVWDDSFVVKALGTGNTENVLFKDSVLWNDFARPMEVGVELRADKVRNIRFENIDVIHSTTGYPLMGIHHGDHAEVSDIVFDQIRIEDTPGAQLFDIRIADSVWNRDNAMGRIRNVTFSNIDYIGSENNDVLLSNSRIEGFSGAHDIQTVRFHNIAIKGKKVKTAKELCLDSCDFVRDVSVTSDLNLEEAAVLSCTMAVKDAFVLQSDGLYQGSVLVCLTNNTVFHLSGTARFAVAPKHMAEEKAFPYDLKPGESSEYQFGLRLQPGKYVFFLKNDKNELENSWLYQELEEVLQEQSEITSCPVRRFVNYYGMQSVGVRMSAEHDQLVLMAELENSDSMDFVVYTAMPARREEGEVVFTVEETDFGESCALLQKGQGLVPAPQLRCPAEITYVFRNEPKVKEIRKTKIRLTNGAAVKIPFQELGIDPGAESFLLEIAADAEETRSLRYPYTLFHSTSPEKTAHMFGMIHITK